MKKKEPVRVPGVDPEGPPTSELILKVQMEYEVYEDGLVRNGERVIWKHDKITNGLANILGLAAVAVSKDAYLHGRWRTIDKAYVEELEKRAKNARAALRKKK